MRSQIDHYVTAIAITVHRVWNAIAVKAKESEINTRTCKHSLA